ncbi:MAG: hypothetical protein E7035_09255 [Verrucomicrobiaceae bacterium]|nr:hypothetical protein [Verrucomicrobiaceae bacterium]
MSIFVGSLALSAGASSITSDIDASKISDFSTKQTIFAGTGITLTVSKDTTGYTFKAGQKNSENTIDIKSGATLTTARRSETGSSTGEVINFKNSLLNIVGDGKFYFSASAEIYWSGNINVDVPVECRGGFSMRPNGTVRSFVKINKDWKSTTYSGQGYTDLYINAGTTNMGAYAQWGEQTTSTIAEGATLQTSWVRATNTGSRLEKLTQTMNLDGNLIMSSYGSTGTGGANAVIFASNMNIGPSGSLLSEYATTSDKIPMAVFARSFSVAGKANFGIAPLYMPDGSTLTLKPGAEIIAASADNSQEGTYINIANVLSLYNARPIIIYDNDAKVTKADVAVNIEGEHTLGGFNVWEGSTLTLDFKKNGFLSVGNIMSNNMGKITINIKGNWLKNNFLLRATNIDSIRDEIAFGGVVWQYNGKVIKEGVDFELEEIPWEEDNGGGIWFNKKGAKVFHTCYAESSADTLQIPDTFQISVATDIKPNSYTLYCNDKEVAVQDNPYFTNITADKTGIYKYYVKADFGDNNIVQSDDVYVEFKESIIVDEKNTFGDFSIADGASFTLSVKCTSKSDVSYKWEVDKQDGNGFVEEKTKTETYTAKASSNMNGWVYRCTMSNGIDDVTVEGKLTILEPVSNVEISSVPAYFKVGDPLSISVEALGDELSYQWEYYNPQSKSWTVLFNSLDDAISEDSSSNEGEDGFIDADGNGIADNLEGAEDAPSGDEPADDEPKATIEGARSAVLTVSELFARDNNAQYRCVVSNNGSTATSKPIKVVVVAQPTYELDKKHAPEAFVGGKATFAIKASKIAKDQTGTLKYQWYKNGVAIEKATKASYTTLPLEDVDFKDVYYCKILVDVKGETANLLQTEDFKITKLFNAKVATSPADFIAEDGGEATFKVSVTAESGTKITYQWQVCTAGADPTVEKNWKSASGKTETLVLKKVNVKLSGNLYRCKVSNDGNKKDPDVSDWAKLEVKAPAIVKTQPKAITAYETKIASFAVVAQGYKVKYQWQVSATGKDDNSWSDIAGQTSDELTIIADENMFYRCMVYSDGYKDSAVFTKSAKLTVNEKAKINDVVVMQGKSTLTKDNTGAYIAYEEYQLDISVSASGKGIKYQWYESSDGIGWTAVKGGTKAKLSIKPNLLEDKIYYCKVYNGSAKVKDAEPYSDGTSAQTDDIIINIKSCPLPNSIQGKSMTILFEETDNDVKESGELYAIAQDAKKLSMALISKSNPTSKRYSPSTCTYKRTGPTSADITVNITKIENDNDGVNTDKETLKGQLNYIDGQIVGILKEGNETECVIGVEFASQGANAPKTLPVGAKLTVSTQAETYSFVLKEKGVCTISDSFDATYKYTYKANNVGVLVVSYKDGKIPVEHEYTFAFDTENNGGFVEKLSVNKKVEEMKSGSFKLE